MSKKPAKLTPARIASNKRNITKRQQELDAKARAKGWRGYSETSTACICGYIEIPQVPEIVIINRKQIPR